MPQKPILIAGGGLASLLLAQSLRRASIPFRTFERDASLSFRAQGYRLRLSAEGLDAVESALGPDGFAKFWAACGKTAGKGVATLNAITGEEIVKPAKDEAKAEKEKEKEGPPKPQMGALDSRAGQVVGISRGEMRRLFLAGCEDYIDWSHHVRGYELTPNGVHAIFADGSKSVEGDMLVGGEGIHSTIAKQLSNGKLKVYDTGARGIHGQAPTTAFKDLGEGVWSLRDDTKPGEEVFAITNVRSGDMDDPSVEFGWTMGARPGVINPPNNNFTIIGKPAADIAKSLSANWSSRVRPLFEQMNEAEAAFWKITCSTPTGVPEWQSEPRVTVIGDAVHSMTPAGTWNIALTFATSLLTDAGGLGANTAMRDSELLGRLIAEAGGYADGITAAYEKEMRVYGSETVKISYGLAKENFGILIDENTPTV